MTKMCRINVRRSRGCTECLNKPKNILINVSHFTDKFTHDNGFKLMTPQWSTSALEQWLGDCGRMI